MSRRFFFDLPVLPWEDGSVARARAAFSENTLTHGARVIPPASVWIGHREALRRLGLNARTAAKLMARTAPEHAPWIDVGTGRHHHYRWKADAIHAWLQSVARVVVVDGKPARVPTAKKPKKRTAARAARDDTRTTRTQLGQSGSLVRLVVDNAVASHGRDP